MCNLLLHAVNHNSLRLIYSLVKGLKTLTCGSHIQLTHLPPSLPGIPKPCFSPLDKHTSMCVPKVSGIFCYNLFWGFHKISTFGGICISTSPNSNPALALICCETWEKPT